MMLIPAKSSISFKDHENIVAKLKLQLDYDNLTQVKFFSIIFESYLKRDPRLISILEEKNNKTPNKIKRNKDLKRTKEVIYDFNLEENEISDIFDIIARENPDL